MGSPYTCDKRAGSPFISASRARTHDLLITFGPTGDSGLGKKNKGSQPGLIAANLHLAQEIGLAVWMRLPRERPRNLDLLALLGVSISGFSVGENEGLNR